MRRLNIKLSVSLVVGLLVMVAGVHVIHGIQIDKNAVVLLKEAEKAEQDGEPGMRRAVKKYGQYLKHRPDGVGAQEKFALLAADLANMPGSSQEEMRLAYRALDVAAKHPELIEVRRRIIDYYMRLGRYVDATEYLEKLRAAARESGKREPALDVKFARCQVVLGHHDSAIKVLNELVGYDKKTKTFDAEAAVAPWEIDAYLTLQEVLRRRLDDADLADEVMQQMVIANPDSSDAYLRLGRYEMRQMRAEKAIAAFDRALELSPDDPDVILEVADIAITRKDFDRARPLLEAGLKNHPDIAEMYRAMGALTLAEGRTDGKGEKGQMDGVDGAIQQVLAGLEHAPNSPTLMMFLVDLQLMKAKTDFGGVKDAIERMRTARMPKEFIDFYEAALAIRQRKWPVAAEKYETLRPLMARWPDRVAQIDLALGQCYENLAQPDRQAEAYRRVLDVQPDQPLARLGHSRAIMSLGKRKEGLAELEKVARELRARNIDAPQVRANVLQARISEQLQKPVDERKWDDIDALVQEMLDDENMDDLKKGLLRVEMCSMKGDLEEAKALITPLLEENPKDVRVWMTWFGIEERLTAQSRAANGKRTADEQLQAIHDAVDDALGRVAKAEEAAGDQAAFRVLRAAAVARLGGDEAKQKLAALEEGIDQFTPEEQVTIWEGLGNAYQRIRDYENVRRCYQKLVDQSPNDLFPWENMFDVATTYGDEKGAAEAASEIKRVSGGAGSASYKYCLASQLIGKVIAAVSQKKAEPAREKERLDEARKLIDEIRRARPDWHQTYRLEGEIDDLEGHFDAAIANYQRALELGSTNANTARRVVILLFQQNRMSEVQAALKHVGRDSSNPMLERINVESKFRTGDREAALQMAKESVAALPDDSPAEEAATAHVWYGKLLESDNHLDEAEQEYRAALEQKPESANLWMLLISNLATASKKAEVADKAAAKKAEAAEAIAKAKESIPEKDKPSLLAQSYEAINELGQAEECLLAAVKDNPGNLNVPRNVAAFYLRHGMMDKAREQIESILASKQDDSLAAANRAWARRSLAEILARQGDFADVQKAIQLVQQNNSDGKGTVADARFIAGILANRPDPESREKAIQMYEKLADQQALSVQERMALALLYNRAGKWSKARDQVYALLGRMPKNPVVLANWIQMLLEHDELQNLDKWMEKLEEAAPKSDLTIQLKLRWLTKQEKTQEATEYVKGLVSDLSDPSEPLKPEQVAMLGKVAAILEDLKDYPDSEKYMRQWYENEPAQTLAFAAFLGRRGKLDEAFILFDKVREKEFATAGAAKSAPPTKEGEEQPRKGQEEKNGQPENASEQVVPQVFVAAVQTLRLNPGKTALAYQKMLEQWLTAAIEQNPTSAPLKLLLVDLNDIEGRFGDSMKLYRSLLAGSELNERQRAVVQNNLAYLLVTRGTKKDVAEAQTLIEESVAHFGPIGGVLDTRGLIRLAEGDTKAAVDDFKTAVAQLPTAVNFFHLALAEEKMGNAAGVNEAFAKAEELKLDSTQLSPGELRDYKRLQKSLAKPGKG